MGPNSVILTNNENNKYMKEVHFIEQNWYKSSNLLARPHILGFDFLIFYHKKSAPNSKRTVFAFVIITEACETTLQCKEF